VRWAKVRTQCPVDLARCGRGLSRPLRRPSSEYDHARQLAGGRIADLPSTSRFFSRARIAFHGGLMRIFPIILVVLSGPTFADTIYQCRDAAGRATLQDSPCRTGVQERAIPSGQDVARERYLDAGGDFSQRYGRSVTYAAGCEAVRNWYNEARKAADNAVSSGDLRRMQSANASVEQAGRQISERGC
jgi:hypothetical protein